MRLQSIRIENYRAIRRAAISFEPTTVLIGENDCGRTSVLEALKLILGAPDERFEAQLRPVHFHLVNGKPAGPLCIVLKFSVDSDQVLRPEDPAILTQLRRRSARGRFDFELELRAELVTGEVRTSIVVAGRGVQQPMGVDAGLLSWIRAMIPVLCLRAGWPGTQADPALSQDPAIAELQQHYRNLLTGETPDISAELEAATMSALNVMTTHPQAFADTVPMISAIASDILNRSTLTQTGAQPRTITSADKIGLVVLLGSMLQLESREILPRGRPLLLIENPETNLHPMTLASMWRIIEQVQWPKVITTNSTAVLANVQLGSIRRLTRSNGVVTEWSAPPRFLPRDDLRRVSYHVRSRRAAAMFARCWVLCEGETEFWVLPELARICGQDFSAEGIACLEYAQCGLEPLIRLANRLGIEWCVVADGDDAGHRYAAQARRFDPGTGEPRLTLLGQRDIEHCFWDHGFADVISSVARANPGRRASPSALIRNAIDKTSKPYLALQLIDAAAERGSAALPPPLRQVIEAAVRLARRTPMPPP